jgi:hypothetical protein
MSNWKEAPTPELLTLLRQYCIAFILADYADNPENPQKTVVSFSGASAFLWQTDQAKFIVTAYHVWEEFRNKLKKRPNGHLIFYLDGDHAIPIFNFEVVSEDKSLDLVVLGGDGIEKLDLKEKAFFHQNNMPPTEVTSGSQIALLGYPKSLRIAEEPYNTIGIVFMFGRAIVSEYGLKIRMLGNTPNKFRSAAVPSLENFEMPGSSGGPVFLIGESGFQWIGIVSEGGQGPDSDLIIVPSKHIGIDGRIFSV